MKEPTNKTIRNKYIAKLMGTALLGFIASFIIITAYYITGGKVLCTAIENLMSPNLILVITTFSLCLHSISIIFSCLRESVKKYYLFAAESVALISGTVLSLSIYYYLIEFGLEYDPFLKKAIAIITVTLILFFLLTIFPFLIFMTNKINKKNYNENSTNKSITAFIIIFTIICMSFTLWGDKIDDIEICPKEECTHLSFRVSGLK